MHRLALGKLAYLQVCSQLRVEMVIWDLLEVIEKKKEDLKSVLGTDGEP